MKPLALLVIKQQCLYKPYSKHADREKHFTKQSIHKLQCFGPLGRRTPEKLLLPPLRLFFFRGLKCDNTRVPHMGTRD